MSQSLNPEVSGGCLFVGVSLHVCGVVYSVSPFTRLDQRRTLVQEENSMYVWYKNAPAKSVLPLYPWFGAMSSQVFEESARDTSLLPRGHFFFLSQLNRILLTSPCLSVIFIACSTLSDLFSPI